MTRGWVWGEPSLFITEWPLRGLHGETESHGEAARLVPTPRRRCAASVRQLPPDRAAKIDVMSAGCGAAYGTHPGADRGTHQRRATRQGRNARTGCCTNEGAGGSAIAAMVTTPSDAEQNAPHNQDAD